MNLFLRGTHASRVPVTYRIEKKKKDILKINPTYYIAWDLLYSLGLFNSCVTLDAN